MDYKYHFFGLRQILGLVLLTALDVCLIYEHQTAWAVVVAAGILSVFCLIIRSQYRFKEKYDLMMKAFINDDFSFRFPVKGRWDYTTYYLNSMMDSYSRMLYNNRKALAEQETFYKLILGHINTGVIVVNGADQIIQCNRKALNILGMPALTRLSQLNRLGEYVTDAFRLSVSDAQRRLSFETSQGTKEILLGITVLNLEHEKWRIFTLNDLRTAVDDRELDAWIKMSHVLTHEIMNAMAPVVSLSASLLEKKNWAPEQFREGLSVINTTSQGLLSWVENYRKFSSLPTPESSLFYVHELTDEIKVLKIVPEHIMLQISVTPDDILLYADQRLIRQVVINLVRNAVQAVDRHSGHIAIQAYVREDEHVIIKVCNDGPVISEEVRQHIFVPFFTTKPHGSGIGLSVSRQIMTVSNGSITLLPAGTAGWNTTFVLDFA